ncbi:MAG TPA: glycosyltransferase [Chitinophagaceae bacterium]|nr:glycosyltransferase [Chitinophagaceae bacterium]MCC6636056.1 glycosyltransferase [Chitinophagaceae bacterium]HMZ45217.1 glycosyltransferase [Chitinophagaceae bacterium]HNE92941.1 glycosyltransferase [Chitinophagaceae bacterium]HNF29143.1 glycosyltransferase [Chitinophagaceae bacterium]
MNLGIVSDCVHFTTPTGVVATDNHIFLRQLNALAVHFDRVTICCPFIEFDDSKSYSVYTDKKFHFIPLSNPGGNSIKHKLKLLLTIPEWFKAFSKINKASDIVYQRFPNNLNIPGFFYFYFKRKKVFATYTGAWKNEINQSKTYQFQKWLLKKFFRGPVWVYSSEEKLAKNIFGGFSPSYTIQEWNEETVQVNNRINFLSNNKLTSLKLISVGALNSNKNQQYILNNCLLLKQATIPFSLHIVGEGVLKNEYQNFIDQHNLNNEIILTGALNYTALRNLYREKDFVVQATLSEGFGKVPIEGFFHGLVPILHQSVMAPYFTNNGTRGYLFNAENSNDLFHVLSNVYSTTSAKLIAEKIKEGRIFVQSQTLENWASIYFSTVKKYFDL